MAAMVECIHNILFPNVLEWIGEQGVICRDKDIGKLPLGNCQKYSLSLIWSV